MLGMTQVVLFKQNKAERNNIMTWLLIWIILVVINTVTALIFAKKDKSEITYFDLFAFFIFGIIFAPLLTGIMLVGITIEFYNKLSIMNIMGKTIYKFK